MQAAFINGLGVFLPNDPINNDEIEPTLGKVNDRSSQVKSWVLDYNGIETRYYAIDPETHHMTHTNAQMTAAAVRAATQDASRSLEEIECLACGTSSADQMIPNHAAMVQGELGTHSLEIAATTGVCCSGMTALKYAYLDVASGCVKNAVATGSELASVTLRASHFKPEMELKLQELKKQPMLAFENEFLRWMLSDGAGAVWIADTPREDGRSLRIDWLDIVSYAHEAQTCMYFGAAKKKDGTLEGFRVIDDPQALCKGGYLSLAQDVEVLRNNLPMLFRRACLAARDKHHLTPDKIDWILPHYSSEGFRQPLYDGLVEEGFVVPLEKWFTNLKTKGNTGSASIYIILEELMSSGRAKTGDRIVCIVPESARFTFALMHLTVV